MFLSQSFKSVLIDSAVGPDLSASFSLSCFRHLSISMLVYLSLNSKLHILFSAAKMTSVNLLRIASIWFRMGSLRYMLKGIFSRPSKNCRALDPESSDFALTSFSFCIAFSFTKSGAFKRQICCSKGIFCMSKFAKSFVYWIVFFIASLKHCLIDHGKLSKIVTCSNESTVPFTSFDIKSYNKYAKYWLSYLSDLTNNWISVKRFEYKSLEMNSLTAAAIVFCLIEFRLLKQPAYFE